MLKLLHRALNIEDPQQDQLLQDLLFAEPVKKPKVFPLSSAIKGLIKEEWRNPDKRMSVNTRLSKMYPFHPDEIVMWEEAPSSGRSGGEAVQENDASARGTIAGAALKPASAVAVTARVLRGWCNSLETDLIDGARRPDLLASIQDMQVAIEFICQATMD